VFLDLLLEIALVLILVVPVGFLALSLSGRSVRGGDLALALALGYAIQMPLVLAELHTRVPGLTLGRSSRSSSCAARSRRPRGLVPSSDRSCCPSPSSPSAPS
jgi:hypothetical protein